MVDVFKLINGDSVAAIRRSSPPLIRAGGLVLAEEAHVLDAYIIDQIRKREEESRRIHERPALKLPLVEPPRRDELEEDTPEPSRVIIIDLV